MRTIWTKTACVFLTVILLAGITGATADAANQYHLHAHWKAVTASRATEMYENGDGFILYCYRAGCSNCQTIGNQLIREWMRDFGTDVYGLNVDGFGGIPFFVFGGVKKSRTLPFVAFVRDGQVMSFSKEGTTDEYMQTLRDAFARFRQGGLLQNRLTVAAPPATTRFSLGAQLDLTGLMLQAAYTDGKTETVTDGYTATGFASDTPGRKTITVLYDGMQTSFDVQVDTPDGAPAVWIIPPDSADLPFARSLTLTADTDNMPDGVHIEWRCEVQHAFSEKTMTGTGNTFSVTAQGKSQTVTVYAQITDANGSEIARAQQHVRFDNGPHSRFLYWQETLRYTFENAADLLLHAVSVFVL